MPDNKIEKLSGAAFLAYPEMSGMLKTELAGRLNFNSKPTAVYGDLLYYADFPIENVKDENDLPYWSRSTMLEPMIINFESIG